MRSDPCLFASTDDEDLASLLESIGDAVCMVDRDLRFIAANRLFANFYGLKTPEALLNRTAFEVYPAFRQSVFFDACMDTINTGQTVTRFGYSANLSNWVVMRCYNPRPNRYVMVVHRVTKGTGKSEYSTDTDPVTSLPNRLAFEQDAQNLMSHGQQRMSLTLVDIRHFKQLNEKLGFDVGDKCLMALASRLKFSVLPADRVYRVGNDQFLIAGVGDAAALDIRREQLNKALAEPLTMPDDTYVLHFHRGSHVVHHPETPTVGLGKAERALMMAKNRRLAEVTYTPTMGASNFDPLLAKEIQAALNDGHLELFFQPQIEALENQVVGAEALIRWKHPQKGWVSPGRFLPYAEETGLIEGIDRHVVQLVFKQMAAWQAQGKRWPLAFNLSAQSLCNLDLLTLFREELAATQVDPTLLHLEITETSLMPDAATSQQVIEGLKNMGLEIGIDDFGTGYASMAYLARYPTHALKVDLTFVQAMEQDINQRVMVRNMISLAHSLGIKVVAEGVETDKQAQMLRSYGCDILQGYLFSPPIPLADFEAWVKDHGGMQTMASAIR